MSLASRLVATLPENPPNLFNPWVTPCEYDHPSAGGGPDGRLERLERHLECDAKVILVGEACGYQGCRYSGIAFTSERLLMEGAIPRIAPPDDRLSVRPKPFSEPSATIVWKTLYKLGLAEGTVLWNALPLHPHRPGEPWSNRTPADGELVLGRDALVLLLEHFRGALVIAVGRKAELALTNIGLPFDAAVRHPANGGATAFAAGVSEAHARWVSASGGRHVEGLKSKNPSRD